MRLSLTLRRYGAALAGLAVAALMLVAPQPASAVYFGLGGNVGLNW
ncbi:hypothetical protein ACFV1L_11665 [Kitasatospora sp. NPDC059646]